MSDLFVADEGVADVQVRSPTQIYVYGKKPGETKVSATTKGGAVVFAIFSTAALKERDPPAAGRLLSGALEEADAELRGSAPGEGLVLELAALWVELQSVAEGLPRHAFDAGSLSRLRERLHECLPS